MKRIRRPTLKDGELRMYWGIIDGSPDVIYEWKGDLSMKRDSRMLHNFLASQSPNPLKMPIFSEMKPSFLEELESRGYDLTTIKFSIMKKLGEAS